MIVGVRQAVHRVGWVVRVAQASRFNCGGGRTTVERRSRNNLLAYTGAGIAYVQNFAARSVKVAYGEGMLAGFQGNGTRALLLVVQAVVVYY